MPLLPLHGHDSLRASIKAAIARGTLPASLLLHGPAGAGKERLALWIGQRLLCASPTSAGDPCGACQQCTFADRGAHPDLHWYFPRPRLKDADPTADDVAADLADAAAARVKGTGVWDAPAPTDALYVATIRALVRRSALTPAMAARKVIVVADADRLVPQEGSDAAANAFLKLLEEPLADTTIILTSSAPGALLPTIRSRVIAVRVPPLAADAARDLASAGVTPGAVDAPARDAAAAMLAAAGGDAARRYRNAFGQGASGARGNFVEALHALTTLLHERTRAAADRGDPAAAVNAARAVAVVEDAKRLTRQNVNPSLITATLLDDLAPLVS